MSRTYLRGEIYYADLDPVVGSEQMGTRPVLILQNNVGNHFARTVIVAPITSRIHTKSKIPTHSYIGIIGRMKYPSVVMLEQLRTLDKRRIGYYIGRLPEEKNAGCDQSAVRQPCHPPKYVERNVIRNGKIVYPEGSCRTAGNQHHNSGCGKEQRSHRLCAVCSQWLRFLYQRQSPGIRCQMYAQSKAYGEENDLPQCAEGPSARLMPNYLRPPFHSFLH